MAALRTFFANGPDEMNFILFSTSGVHGSYSTIEEEESPDEETLANYRESGEERQAEVTFIIVQPRLVALRYGNVSPKTPEDFAYLKELRQKSWEVVQTIGR